MVSLYTLFHGKGSIVFIEENVLVQNFSRKGLHTSIRLSQNESGMGDVILEVRKVSKSYREQQVLREISISCHEGEICGLLGANGAGKTTLFKIICGLLTPDSGEVSLHTNRVKPIGAIIEKPALYEYLNAKENIDVFSRLQGLNPSREEINSFLTTVGLPIDRKDPVKNFSMGMKQRLGIAISLLNHPQCLILDEPFSGLDPLGIEELRNIILNLANKEGLTILVSSHIIEELSKVSNRLFIMSDGVIKNTGPTQRIIREHTFSYTICAEQINRFDFGDRTTTKKGDCISIHASPDEITGILQSLNDAGIRITSCIPEINMNRLFNQKT